MSKQEFKPYANDSQQKNIGNDDHGEMSFTNDEGVVVLEGRLEIPKTPEGLKYIGALLSTMSDMQQEVLQACGKELEGKSDKSAKAPRTK